MDTLGQTSIERLSFFRGKELVDTSESVYTEVFFI